MTNGSKFTGVIGLLVIGLFASSCSGEKKNEANAKSGGAMLDMPAKQAADKPGTSASAAGIQWKVPASWAQGPEKPMRAATYMIGTGAEQAECAVFYFGNGQGGDVQANIGRWIGQVKQPDGSSSEGKAKKSEVKSACCSISTIEVAGTYLASAGPMMQVKEEKPGYELIGGIAPAPEGNVFFKLTGPQKTVEKIREEFLGMLKSVSKS